MKSAWLTLLVVAGASLVSTVQVHAQPLFATAASIESTVANADLVVIGKLVDDYASNATIAVEETLKKDIFTIEPYRRLRVHIPSPASVLADWKKRSCRLLVAMKECDQDAITVIELTPDSLEVLTRDFTLLRNPNDVIRTAKATVRGMPAAVRQIHTVELEVPRETVAGTKWDAYYETGGYLKLSVPVDERLENRALEYIRSENHRRREEGVRALRYFNSEEGAFQTFIA